MADQLGAKLRCRVTLPSGRVADAILEACDWTPSAHPVRLLRFDADSLSLCPHCWNKSVGLGDAVRAGIAFEIRLYCRNCSWSGSGFADETLVDFLTHLDAARRAALAQDHNRFDLAVMSDEVDAFAAALQAGQIVPEDF